METSLIDVNLLRLWLASEVSSFRIILFFLRISLTKLLDPDVGHFVAFHLASHHDMRSTCLYLLSHLLLVMKRLLICTCRSEDQLDNTGVNTHAHRAPPNAADTNMPSYHSNSSMNGPTSLYDRNDVSPNPSLQSGNGIPHRTVSTGSHME